MDRLKGVEEKCWHCNGKTKQMLKPEGDGHDEDCTRSSKKDWVPFVSLRSARHDPCLRPYAFSIEHYMRDYCRIQGKCTHAMDGGTTTLNSGSNVDQ